MPLLALSCLFVSYDPTPEQLSSAIDELLLREQLGIATVIEQVGGRERGRQGGREAACPSLNRKSVHEVQCLSPPSLRASLL